MSKHQVPTNETPTDEPPPYSEIAEGGSVSVDEGAGLNEIRQWDVQTNRPLNASSTGASNVSSSSSGTRPPAPLPDTHRPPPGPPPTARPSSRPSSISSTYHRPPPGPPPNRLQHTSSRPPPDSKLRPPPGRPESTHSAHSAHSAHSSYSSNSAYSNGSSGYGPAPYSQNLPPQWPPMHANPHLRYPQGYFCKKCHNTGIKVKKGTTCKDCYDRFAVRSQPQYLPPGMMPMFPVPPRVVMPGDPSIGGTLCGRCRGSGIVHDLFIFEDSCPVCHGVGRVF